MSESLFKIHSNYKPSGDQPQAIEELVKGIEEGKKEDILVNFFLINVAIFLKKFFMFDIFKTSQISRISEGFETIICGLPLLISSKSPPAMRIMHPKS